MAFQQLSGVNAVMFYAETIFEEAKFQVRASAWPALSIAAWVGLPPQAQGAADQPRPVLPYPQDSSLASVVLGIVQVLFTALAALIMDRAGRRLLLTVSGETLGEGSGLCTRCPSQTQGCSCPMATRGCGSFLWFASQEAPEAGTKDCK